MAFLAPELSVGELTLLLLVIVIALIPLTIRALCNDDKRPKARRLNQARTEISQHRD